MKTKTIVIGVAILIAIVVLGFFFMKKKNATSGVDGSALGKKKNGNPYYQTDIDLTVTHIKGTPNWLADVKLKAEKAGRSLDEQLKMEAKYMLENA